MKVSTTWMNGKATRGRNLFVFAHKDDCDLVGLGCVVPAEVETSICVDNHRYWFSRTTFSDGLDIFSLFDLKCRNVSIYSNERSIGSVKNNPFFYFISAIILYDLANGLIEGKRSLNLCMIVGSQLTLGECPSLSAAAWFVSRI